MKKIIDVRHHQRFKFNDPRNGRGTFVKIGRWMFVREGQLETRSVNDIRHRSCARVVII